MSFSITIRVTATCDHCTWKREFTGPNATLEASGAATGHIFMDHAETIR